MIKRIVRRDIKLLRILEKKTMEKLDVLHASLKNRPRTMQKENNFKTESETL